MTERELIEQWRRECDAARRRRSEQRWLRVGFVLGWVVVFSLVCWAVAQASSP